MKWFGALINKKASGPEKINLGEGMDAVEAIPQKPGFHKEFDGLQFRVHKAVGGHIVEVWHNQWRIIEDREDRYHELFLVPDDKTLADEIPSIITQAMLKQQRGKPSEF